MKEMEDRGWSKNGWATFWAMAWAQELSNTMDRYPMPLGDTFADVENYRFASQEFKAFPGWRSFGHLGRGGLRGLVGDGNDFFQRKSNGDAEGIRY